MRDENKISSHNYTPILKISRESYLKHLGVRSIFFSIILTV